jgi:hypothetical protein
MDRTPANIKSNSNKSFKPSLGENRGSTANTNKITITDSSNMIGHPNHPNANVYRGVNSNVNSNMNR